MPTFSERLGPAASGIGVKTIYQNAYSSLKPTSPVQPLTPPTMISATANSGCGVDTIDMVSYAIPIDSSYTVDSMGNWVWTEVPIKFPSPILNLFCLRPSGSAIALRFSPVKIGLNKEWYQQSVAGIPAPLLPMGNQTTWYQFCSPVDILYFSYATQAVPGDKYIAVLIGTNKISYFTLNSGIPL